MLCDPSAATPWSSLVLSSLPVSSVSDARMSEDGFSIRPLETPLVS